MGGLGRCTLSYPKLTSYEDVKVEDLLRHLGWYLVHLYCALITSPSPLDTVRRLAILAIAHTWFADVNIIPNKYKDLMDMDAAMEIENIVKVRNVPRDNL